MDNSKGHVGGISISSDLGRYVLVIINVDIAVGVEDPKRCSSTLVFTTPRCSRSLALLGVTTLGCLGVQGAQDHCWLLQR